MLTAGHAKLEAVLVRLLKHYPHPDELSKARTTKLVYLIDWYAAREMGRQITDVDWMFNHYGPYVDDVVNLAKSNPLFEVIRTENMYGSPKEVLRLKARSVEEPQALSDQERHVVDRVIEETSPLYWQSFISKVYKTYPVATQPRYTRLDLTTLAREAKNQEVRDQVRRSLRDRDTAKSLITAVESVADDLLGEPADDYVDAGIPSDVSEAAFAAVTLDWPVNVGDAVTRARRRRTSAERACRITLEAECQFAGEMFEKEWNLRPDELDAEEGVEFVRSLENGYVEVLVTRSLMLEFGFTLTDSDETEDVVLIDGMVIAEPDE